MKGILVAFEGIDGSGKTTQIELLSKKLKIKNIPFEVISFPQYGKNKYASQIEDYLSGKLGSLSSVNPKDIAKAYASDRQLAKAEIEKWLDSGKLVIANRYASASQAHLGANMPENEREDFFKWLEKLEFETNKIPKEDLTILLDVDPKVGQKNVAGEEKKDIHEENLKHLEQARKIYLMLAKKNPNWYVVDCMKNGEMKTREEIEGEITVILNEVKDL